ncbi:MAG: hypothetical protein QME96_11455, partial [Myxococcota bacterium]|nr:hypothetical protein [Myxococcota bacterium]
VEPGGAATVRFEAADRRPPTADRRIELAFRVAVPERFGVFGRAGGVMVLGGGWHPLLMGRRADGAFDERAPIERADYDVRVAVPAGLDVVVDGAGPFRCEAERGARCIVERSSRGAEPPAVIVAERFHRRSVRGAGIEIVLLSPSPPPEPRSYAARTGRGLDGSSVPDLRTIDHHGRMLRVLAGALDALDRAALLPSAAARPAQVPIAIVPLRLDLAAGVEGTVLLSDRAYQLFPFERFLRFHDREVLRAVLTEVFRAALGDRPLAEARWTAETAAAAALDRLSAPAGGGRDRAEDLLRYGAFLPVVDQMIFAPLMEFRDVYYPSVEETDSLRDEIWRLGTDLPRGRRIWAKLVDRLGPDRALAAVRSTIESGAPLRETASAAADEGHERLCRECPRGSGGREARSAELPPGMDDLSGFFDVWLGRYPRVNLALVGFDCEPLDDGMFRTVVRLRRDGDPSAREVAAVRIRFEDGTTRDVTWDAVAATGEVATTAAACAEDVELDPEGRVVEDPALSDGHPRADNASSLPWRLPVLDKIRVSLDLDDLAASQVDIDVTMRRRFDLRQAFRGRVSRDARGIGGSLAYLRGFGPPRDMNRPSWMAMGWVEAFRWDEEFGFRGTTTATTIEIGGFVGHDDRWYDIDPADGWQALLALSAAIGLDVADVWSVRPAGRAFYLWTPASGHTFAVYGGFALALGEPLRAQLESLGDRLFLRSLAPDEALGRAKLYAVAEYRHLLVRDLDWNLLHLAWLRGIQGVLFGGFGTTSRADSLDGMFEQGRIFLEAGYGLRLFLDYAGVQTGLVSLDVGVPFGFAGGRFGILGQTAAEPDDRASYRRRPALFGLPIGAHLSFYQTF